MKTTVILFIALIGITRSAIAETEPNMTLRCSIAVSTDQTAEKPLIKVFEATFDRETPKLLKGEFEGYEVFTQTLAGTVQMVNIRSLSEDLSAMAYTSNKAVVGKYSASSVTATLRHNKQTVTGDCGSQSIPVKSEK